MKAEDIRRGGILKKSEPLLESEPESKPRECRVRLHNPNTIRVVKYPWPGDWCIVREWMYDKGMTGDRSGKDAMKAWASTATLAELDWAFGPVGSDGNRITRKGYCYKLGMLHGLIGGTALWPQIFKLFGLFQGRTDSTKLFS
jgi:hypothetical protein